MFQRPRIFGIVNITPDSFSDGGKYFDPAAAIAHARKLVGDGADVIDLGPASSNPGCGSGLAGGRDTPPWAGHRGPLG